MIQGLRTFLTSILLVVVLALTALAQDVPDYAAWETTAQRAEQVLDSGRASDAALETLRAQIVDWRTQFQEAQGANGARIETLRSQIDALGPAPAEGEVEPDAIAEQRSDLNRRLAEAEVPVRQAEAQLRRAQGLIGEIDDLIAQRQAGELLSLGPSPLAPANWTEAATETADWLTSLWNEVSRLTGSEVHRAEFRENIPLVIFYLLVAAVLLSRGWRWVGRIMRPAIVNEKTSPLARILLFVLSLMQILVIFVGIQALELAVVATGFVGLRGDVLVQAVGPSVFMILLALWLGRQVFPSRETAVHPLNLTDGQRAQGRWTAVLIGAMIAIGVLIQRVAMAEAFSDAARLTLQFPVVVTLGLLLLRLGRLLTSHSARDTPEGQDATVYNRIIRFIGWAIMALGVGGPILAAIGYFTAGASFLLPATISLALLALVRILQRLVADLYGAVTGKREGLDEALTPTLIGFVLAALSVPLFALVWGVRPAQLVDLWQRVIQGFTIGGVTISPRNFLVFAIIFVIGYTITKLLQGTLRTSVLPKTRLDAGGRNAIVTGTGYVGITLAALIAITTAGIDLSSLAIVAGALSVGIGFGLQTIVSNFVSGIILLVERPIKEGDWIEVNGMMGYVRQISVRSTRIETFDRSDVIVPNADLISGVVTNMTHHNNAGRVIVPVGVAYGTDTEKVAAILQEIAEANPMVLLNPKPNVLFLAFGADSLNFEIRAILRDVNFKLSVHSEMNHAIAKRFAEEGIEIPFAQRDIWIRNPEALGGTAPAPEAAAVQGDDPAAGDATT